MKLSSRSRSAPQRGSILVNAAIVLSLLTILLIGTELGYQFYIKREFQKAADLAALAGAQNLTGNNCAPATAAAIANANDGTGRNLPVGFSLAGGDVACGTWAANATASPDRFTAGGTSMNAVRVQLTRDVTPVIAFSIGAQSISVQAVAARALPRAALNIRSTLLTVDSTQSPLLNSVMGGLLGGSINLSAVSWDGLAKSNVNLLSYLDALAVRLNLAAGQYDTVLNTQTTATQLLGAAVDALNKDGSVAGSITVLNELIRVAANVPSTTLKLSQIVAAQTGTQAAALNLNLQALELAQSIVQLANSSSAVASTTALTIPGIATANVAVKVIEPAQISAIGNPELAKADPTGPNKIHVQTAQVRSVVSVNLPVLSGITGLANAVLGLLAPVTSLLNNVLSLNLVNILCLTNCTQTQVVLVPDNPIHLTISLNVAAASANVTDYDCSAPTNATLTVSERTSAADIRVGQVPVADEPALLTPGSNAPFPPIPLIETQTKTCTLIFCGAWTPAYRTGLAANSSVLASTSNYTYLNVPRIDQTPAYQSFSSTDVVNGLKTTLGGLQLQTFTYSGTAPNRLGAAIGTATQLVQGAVSAAQSVITNLLAPLLDPLVNLLLTSLGIQLAKADIGGRLTCQSGVELVY